MRSGAEGEHRTGEDAGRSRTLDATVSTEPMARGRSRALPAVPAPAASPASSDTGCNRRGCPSNARSFRSRVASPPVGCVSWAVSMRLMTEHESEAR